MSIPNADPRVFGFDLNQGLVPNNDHDGGWGASVPSSDGGDDGGGAWGAAVPSSDGDAGGVVSSSGGSVRPVHAPPQAAIPAHTQPQSQPQGLYRPTPSAPLHAPADQNATVAVPRYANHMASGVSPQGGTYAGLENRPQPQQPPQGHPNAVPGYPWQGHPEQGYSKPLLGPDGTSPMRAGGPNLPAYATAPQRPQGYTGAAYPLNTPGVQEQNAGNPLFGGFAGIDMAALDAELATDWSGKGRDRRKKNRAKRKAARADAKAGKGREVQGKNGHYVYYQYALEGNPIKIVVSGAPSKLPVGTIVREGDPRWSAITAEIGTWADYVLARRKTRVTGTALALTAASNIVAQAAGGRRRRRRGRGRARGGVPAAGAEDLTLYEDDSGGLPPWAVPLGLAAAAGLVLFLATREPAKPPKK